MLVKEASRARRASAVCLRASGDGELVGEVVGGDREGKDVNVWEAVEGRGFVEELEPLVDILQVPHRADWNVTLPRTEW